MKVLIIDDEKKARRLLHTLIEENCPRIKTIFEADHLLAGVEMIKAHQPSIVFLDIEMPNYSGLEILNFISKEDYNFEIIFTTAYGHHALQAFKLAAIDYLLKPIRPTSIKAAVDRVAVSLGNSQLNERLNELKESLTTNGFHKIGLPYSEGIKFVDFQDIIMFTADGMYTKVATLKEEYLVSKPLKYFVESLQNIKFFYRPHRSFLVNLSHIKEYVKKDGGYIIMANNETVSITKEKKEEFLSIVQLI